ncbi:MAG: hypothetical protein K0R36_327 [Chryseobacterium sp.]|jgi:hypothetical protein|nr:hypothetical protein [Chryseobacterium sp.]
MVPPEKIIEFLFGIKMTKKGNLILNLCILLVIITVFLLILSSRN